MYLVSIKLRKVLAQKSYEKLKGTQHCIVRRLLRTLSTTESKELGCDCGQIKILTFGTSLDKLKHPILTVAKYFQNQDNVQNCTLYSRYVYAVGPRKVL